MRIQCFKTSIWNETLFKAWSQIVYSLVPNVDTLEQHLTTFCKHSCADEVVLFERSTFLVISHVSTKAFHDEDRFEKVSNIIKQFKLSCGKVGSQFSSMEVRNSSFTGFIDALTDTTMVMVIISDPTLSTYSFFGSFVGFIYLFIYFFIFFLCYLLISNHVFET
jgi:Ras-related GTP-binding protein A/B